MAAQRSAGARSSVLYVWTQSELLSILLMLLQKLARAVYSRRPLLLLDDPLAGLDNLSEQHIVNRLLGPIGLLKQLGTTVVLATQTGAYSEKEMFERKRSTNEPIM